jgi:hypothetical protein
MPYQFATPPGEKYGLALALRISLILLFFSLICAFATISGLVRNLR